MERDWQSYKFLVVPACVVSVVVLDRLRKWRVASRQPLPKPSFLTGNLFDLPTPYRVGQERYNSDLVAT